MSLCKGEIIFLNILKLKSEKGWLEKRIAQRLNDGFRNNPKEIS